MRENKLPTFFRYVAKPLKGVVLIFTVTVLATVWLSPVFVPQKADAAQITTRALTLSSGVPNQTSVTYTFSFSIPSTAQVQGIKFIACSTAVGTYPPGTSCGTAPAALDFSSATISAQTGWTGSNAFAIDGTGANTCIPAANVICVNRTDATAQTPGSRTFAFAAVHNPSTNNTAFYVGIDTYTTNNYTSGSLTDTGTTASAVVQTLTTYAAVAEILNFCVGSTTVNDVSTSVATDCSTMSGTSLNLGTLDTSAINTSPVNTNGGDNQNGVAMVRSNAGNGTVVEYDAIQQSGTNHLGTLRVSGSTCSASSGPGTGSPPAASGPYTDPCIDAAGTTQHTFSAGTEQYGMTVAGINFGSTSSYTCTYGTPTGNTCNMEPASNYLGSGTGGGTGELYGTTNGFAWDESGTAQPIASSASSTVKQVDDEALILAFAATPSITTPFGAYQVQTDFIAVPTY